MDKQTLRDQLIETRRSISHKEKTKANRAITTSVLAHPEVVDAKTVCVYISLLEEVDTGRLIDALLKSGKSVIVPKVAGDTLMLLPIESRSDLRPGAFGILEPVTSFFIHVAEIDVFLVPGVAFDLSGNRLGRGKGYYDKMLAKVHAPIIGLAYACQVVAQVPTTSYDVSVTDIITEKETYAIQKTLS